MRRYGIFSALVIGSIIPDLLYFVPMLPRSNFGHTIPGLFLFCLPAGLFCLWLFQVVMKRPLVSLFPEYHQQRLVAESDNFRFLPWQRFLNTSLSILFGAVSHIIWDSLTHVNGWAVKRWDFMRAEVVFSSHYHLLVVDLLQQLSTLTGAGLLVYWYLRWIRSAPPMPRNPDLNLSLNSKIALLALFFVGASLPAAYHFLQNPGFWMAHSRRAFVGFSIVSGIKVMYTEVIVFSIAWHFFNRRRLGPSTKLESIEMESH